MTSNQTENQERVKSGIDEELFNQMKRLESARDLLKEGKIKPEVYHMLQRDVVNLQRQKSEGPESITKRKPGARNLKKSRSLIRKKSPLDKVREMEGSNRSSLLKSTTSTGLLRTRAVSIASAFSERAKSAFRQNSESKSLSTTVMEGKLLCLVKAKKKSGWVEIYALLYPDKVVLKSTKKSKTGRTFKLHDELFVSTIMNTNDKKEIKRATEDSQLLSREDMGIIKKKNKKLEENRKIMSMRTAFIVSSLNSSPKKNIEVILSCQEERAQSLWVATMVETIRDLRDQASGFGDIERTGSRKGWQSLKRRTLKRNQGKKSEDTNRMVDIGDDEENSETLWQPGHKIASKEFLDKWGEREKVRRNFKSKHDKILQQDSVDVSATGSRVERNKNSQEDELQQDEEDSIRRIRKRHDSDLFHISQAIASLDPDDMFMT